MGKGKQAERGADRAARLEAARAEQRRGERRRTLTWVGATGAVVVVLVGAVTWTLLASRPTAGSPSLTGLVTYSNLSRDHVTGKVTYAQTPPVGGKHSAVWQNCGIYTAPVADENAVHSMEHGAIWVTYQPNLAADQVTALQGDVRGQAYGLLSPYPGLPTPVVATVWGTQLKLPSATDPRLKVFIARYADATKAPEPRGECTGGLGTPQP
jgi:hypothetical protein